MTLTDLATGATRDMRTSSSFTWQTGEGETTRSFRIEATRLDRSVLRVTDVVARSTNRASGVNISYNLSVPANVEVRILAGGGRAVRQVTGRASRAAGLGQTTWDLKNDQGVMMPSGAYLVEIRAQSADGRQTVKMTAPLILVR